MLAKLVYQLLALNREKQSELFDHQDGSGEKLMLFVFDKYLVLQKTQFIIVDSQFSLSEIKGSREEKTSGDRSFLRNSFFLVKGVFLWKASSFFDAILFNRTIIP